MKGLFIFLGLILGATGMDLDTGYDAVGLEKILREGSSDAVQPVGGWVRLRGIARPEQDHTMPRTNGEVTSGETREALAALRKRGLRVCVLIRWPADWRKIYLPADLREAYEKGRMLAAAYSDLVDAWEIDNEPDLGFVPESAERYTAYLKATYLGLKAGTKERGVGGEGVVVMGALGLPPGPWLERFAANGGFSYMDAFNYHYYGYADDFSAVYRQHENAVKELLALNSQRSGGSVKSFPTFVTEIGYGMLGKEAQDMKDGRLRQWRWFKSVGQQTADLRIEAPMSFLLQPYLEYGINEYGLTAAVPRKPGDGSAEMVKQTETPKPEERSAGGISYDLHDFKTNAFEPWMEMIGRKIGENEVTPALAQWMDTRARSRERGAASRPWTVNVPPSSPVVIDFINGEGLSFVKRYNASFVTAKEPITQKSETGNPKPELGAGETSRPADRRPTTDNNQLSVAPPRTEEFMIHVRTVNGNLYEVYPTRKAMETWERYLEPGSNFTMSFYGRAALPWRFADNKPASLVVVMYPKKLPSIFEFRRAQLIEFNVPQKSSGYRFGTGKLLLYNFGEKPISGNLQLPEGMTVAFAGDAEEGSHYTRLTLAGGERREIDVMVRLPAGGFRRIEAPVRFEPDDQRIPAAGLVSAFMPDIAGMATAVAAELLPSGTEIGTPKQENQQLIASRPRATEEAPMKLAVENPRFAAFVQEGATVEATAEGFAVTVTSRPPGKPQRVEVEIPWPGGVEFGRDAFLSVEYRLRP